MTSPFREHHLFQCLRRFDRETMPLDRFLNLYYRENKALGSKDRRFLSDTIYQLVRWKELYDYLNKGQKNWESRYREMQNTSELPTLPDHIRLGFPKVFLDLLINDHGKEFAIAIAEASNTEAPITIRANPLKTTRDELLEKLPKDWDPKPCLHSSLGIQISKRVLFSELKEFKEGLFEVQDEASQMVANLVSAKPKEKILDFCAGAGGKTLAFASHMKNTGVVYLHDVRKSALSKAKKRLSRAGIYNVQFMDSLSQIPMVDTILIDAPCTGTGTYRRNPDLKWKFDLPLLHSMKETQRAIFQTALPFLKPGGKIIYATCSVLKEENENQIAYFCHQFSMQQLDNSFSSLPTINGMDGFFAATLSKRAD